VKAADWELAGDVMPGPAAEGGLLRRALRPIDVRHDGLPGAISPWEIFSDSGSSITRWIGRAAGSNPQAANSSLAADGTSSALSSGDTPLIDVDPADAHHRSTRLTRLPHRYRPMWQRRLFQPD
jgi:hypothetical protein